MRIVGAGHALAPVATGRRVTSRVFRAGVSVFASIRRAVPVRSASGVRGTAVRGARGLAVGILPRAGVARDTDATCALFVFGALERGCAGIHADRLASPRHQARLLAPRAIRVAPALLRCAADRRRLIARAFTHGRTFVVRLPASQSKRTGDQHPNPASHHSSNPAQYVPICEHHGRFARHMPPYRSVGQSASSG